MLSSHTIHPHNQPEAIIGPYRALDDPSAATRARHGEARLTGRHEFDQVNLDADLVADKARPAGVPREFIR